MAKPPNSIAAKARGFMKFSPQEKNKGIVRKTVIFLTRVQKLTNCSKL
jgi:hypothetical protein